MRKAQVANQFNWIFVLIVGGLFLALFFTMSTKQGKISETRVSATALEGISTIFESARTGNSLSTIIETPELSLAFTCQQGLFNSDTIYSAYSVEGLSKKIPALPTFAPKKLHGTDLSTWTQTWEMPYKVMNFLYIANSKTRFFFVFPDNTYLDLKKEINETFSKNMKVIYLSDISQLSDYNDDLSIVAVFSNEAVDTTAIKNTFANDVSILQIIPDGRDISFGSVRYNAQENKESKYYGMASLYGALFSSDKNYYDCSMAKAKERFKRVSCIQLKKYEQMSLAYATDVECKLAYDTAIQNMKTFFGTDFCTGDTIGTSTELFDSLVGLENEYYYYQALKDTNKRTITKSCELLY